ncbi:putative bifunctional diguanylate cyclase/phosphodiesterase [Xanthomonas arboricola]|jgi:EAL domain-containing protein (putative c-di-GMP-specific phosphodiesterase class I)/GGDEF domain-containing protein|uniref:putative bifunctional diguanylate cyclase/phosphodiesterase n=1 Tax=Xanthomonas arboricola TaxID=56448 RepID=UPI0007EC8314|nr:GGDEF and EAL domain-containing protein [Xanthomonas arboricola]NIK43855.1 EAL domain-containing protein (putative c-di-GMP-specific phosphodiesterase class I)/GGDEF domain-containing protein [Xanthomonas arboricola]OBR76151.1 diguanylate cyclase [Xanthomonas arboricola]PPT58122.1 sensor domain-containing phosphodiesterase [Xanthomonas arboricola]
MQSVLAPANSPLPPVVDESTRLSVLRGLCLLDSPPDPVFETIAAMAARNLGAEIALVSLVDEHRQWFKARIGLEPQETPRDQAFCAHAIRAPEVMVVPDAQLDPRFCDNPLVLGPPFIRFYAGAPLTLRDGHRIGTLCVIGTSPRPGLDAEAITQLEGLRDLAVLRVENLRSTTYRDGPTGLPNRSRFAEDLDAWLSQRDSAPATTAVAVDICGSDYFRDMVKALGWDYADGYVAIAQRRLAAYLPAGTALYRLDPTTFGFLAQAETQRLSALCTKVSKAFAETLEHQGIPHTAVASIGAVSLQTSYGAADTIRSLTTSVDISRERGVPWSMYERKHDVAQRNTFRLLASLPAALDSASQLRLHYQPRVDLHDHRCVGVEALLRWQHPMIGPVMPADFVPMAEKTALINRITAWVIDNGIAQAARWQQQGLDFNLALNVSAADLDRPGFVGLLRRGLERHNLDPRRLEIEFTESAMIRHPEHLAEQLAAIAALGVHIAIDDFGTGYSNFSYLKQLPASSLKIDQSFIRSLPDNRTDRTLVPAMIQLGHSLGQRVVAEGIESAEAYTQLRAWGCDEGQGYWIAKPMPAAALETWLQTPWYEQFEAPVNLLAASLAAARV